MIHGSIRIGWIRKRTGWGRARRPNDITKGAPLHDGSQATTILGITRHALLSKMHEVLNVYGSNALRDALAEHSDVVLGMLTCEGNDSLADIVGWIQEREQVQIVEDVT